MIAAQKIERNFTVDDRLKIRNADPKKDTKKTTLDVATQPKPGNSTEPNERENIHKVLK